MMQMAIHMAAGRLLTLVWITYMLIHHVWQG